MTGRRAGGCSGFSTAAAAGLFLSIAVLTGCGDMTPAQDPPRPLSSPVFAPSATPAEHHPPAAGQVPAAIVAAKPAAVRFPSIGAGSQLLQVGLTPDGVLEVPPGDPGAPAAWFTGSPVPGEPGPAVILGHVNAEGGGAGVFAELRKLQPGDAVEVAREDGTTATFSVLNAEQYPKDAFPTEKVYGNTEGPELRLITCDGYDPESGTFDDNYVVYARLTR